MKNLTEARLAGLSSRGINSPGRDEVLCTGYRFDAADCKTGGKARHGVEFRHQGRSHAFALGGRCAVDGIVVVAVNG